MKSIVALTGRGRDLSSEEELHSAVGEGLLLRGDPRFTALLARARM
jgi:hypothetical protein